MNARRLDVETCFMWALRVELHEPHSAVTVQEQHKRRFFRVM